MGGDNLSVTLTPQEPLWSITAKIKAALDAAGPDTEVTLVVWPKGMIDKVRFTAEEAIPASLLHVDVVAKQPGDPEWPPPPPPPPDPVPAPPPAPPPTFIQMWARGAINIRKQPLPDDKLGADTPVMQLPAGTAIEVTDLKQVGTHVWSRAVIGYVAADLLSATPPK